MEKKNKLERELDQWIAQFYGRTQKGRKPEKEQKALAAGKNAKNKEPGKKMDGQWKNGRRKKTTVGKPGGRKTDKTRKDSIKKTAVQEKGNHLCPVFARCGGCQLLHLPYEQQLKQKQKMMEELLKGICPVHPIVGMENPWHYRNKVHAVFDHDRKGNAISGVYEAGSHRVVPVDTCLLENEQADKIIGTIRGMLKSFKIKTYDEDTGYGFLRHVLIRWGHANGTIYGGAGYCFSGISFAESFCEGASGEASGD